MNDSTGKIWYAAGLDNTELQRDTDKAKSLLNGVGKSAAAQGNEMEKMVSRIGAGIAAAGSVTAMTMLGKQILDVTAKFEKFGIVLNNTLGETKGQEALDMIAKFAATTPFQLDEVTAAFIKMANQGFTPTSKEMTKLGDLASSTGKSFDQLAEAILDAQTNQYERLKEFGIKASTEGDRVTFTFKEQKTTVENTTSAIRAYILGLGDLQGITGANAKISASLTGQLSNLQDKIAAMFNEIGSANKGIMYEGLEVVSNLIDNYEKIGKIVLWLAAAYGSWKAATIVQNAVLAEQAAVTSMVAASNGVLTKGLATQWLWTERLTAAQGRLKAAMLNPYVLAAAAVVALGYATYKLITYQSEVEKATGKAAVEMENERDKASELFTQLKYAKQGSEQYKNAKQAIVDQYGEYLSAQQKELDNLKTQTSAWEAINKGIAENINLRIKRESLDQISERYNPEIQRAQQNIVKAIREELGAEPAFEIQFKLSDFSEKVKNGLASNEEFIGLRAEILRSLGATVDDKTGVLKSFTGTGVSADLQRFSDQLSNWKKETDAINGAFITQQKKIEESEAKPTTTTYAKQIEELKNQLEVKRKELKVLEATPGQNPMKEVISKKGEIDELEKKLAGVGVKMKEEQDQIQAITKAMKTATGEQLKMLAEKLVALERVNAAQQKSIETAKGEVYGKARTAEYEELKGVIGDPNKAATPIVPGLKAKETKAVGLEIDKLIDKVKRYNKAAEEIQSEIDMDKQKEKIRAVTTGFYESANAASYLSQQIRQTNEELADLLDGVSSLASNIGGLIDTGIFSSEGMSKEDAVGSIISGSTQLIGMFISQAAENKRVMEEYYASIIQQQQDYNLLLNEQLRLNSDIAGSVFLRDYEGNLNDATAAYNDAQSKYEAEFKKFKELQAVTGKKNAVSGKNVLTGAGAGAALGAGVGSFIPVIGTAIGAGIGAIVGGISGLFAKKKKDVVAPLLETYPDLIKANGDFNAELAKTLIANDKIAESSKQTLQNMIEWTEAAEAAKEQLRQVISDLTGSLGDDLRNALVAAFEDGTDAAKAFQGSVNKVLENIMSNMIFNKAFEGAFKALEEEMAASYDVTGDQSWLDDFQAFYSQSPDLIEQFNRGMEDARKAAADAGFDIFQNGSGSGMAGQITAAITEDTASELVGLWNRTALDIRENLILCRDAVGHLIQIEANTYRTANNTDALSQLAEVKTSLKSIDIAVNKTASRI